MQCNAATLLEIDEETDTRGNKPTDADILAFIREEFISATDEKGEAEVEEETLKCQFSCRHSSLNPAAICPLVTTG